MRYPGIYRQITTEGVIPILGTLRTDEQQPELRVVPDPYPVVYDDTAHKY